MRILVCVKQVCDSADTLFIDQSSSWVEYGGHTVFRMNRYDEYALEEALRIRERFEGTGIDAVSIGPERAQATIRRALGMGADHGIHIYQEERGYLSPFDRAALISRAAADRGYHLILAGVMAEDDMEGQVGGLVAGMLGYACATSVISQELSPGTGEVLVEREIEGGRRERLNLKLPAVLTIQSGINIPRYPALSHMLRSRTAAIELIEAHALAPRASSGTRIRCAPAEAGSVGEFLEGTPEQKALRLLEILHEHSLL
ncbi:MAG TPA: electron transfer flavoprotein subunit beta/FixA family protein [Deltaproteobacteria bacterium]|jgi:electron transfer flavoprotein beta subunit|nr:electron transfer flavoprotein subunit beta/FixA family protein [Deltaproteobacteria bacterium]HOI06434.1 electron transfer flavoprotein subunit beta/FixA family protein [Deltaproteobacteria bacterium]